MGQKNLSLVPAQTQCLAGPVSSAAPTFQNLPLRDLLENPQALLPQPCQHFWGPSQDSTSRERFRPSPRGPLSFHSGRIQSLTCKFQHIYKKGCHPLAMVLYFLGQRCIWCVCVWFFFFFFCCLTRGILIAQPGIKPTPPAVEPWSLNHYTTREVP